MIVINVFCEPAAWYAEGYGAADLQNNYIDTNVYNATKRFIKPWKIWYLNYGGSLPIVKGWAQEPFAFDGPILKIQAVNPIVDAFSANVSWELIVTNFATQSPGNNVWIAPNLAGTGITLLELKDKATNAVITPTGGGIYQLGNYAATQEKEYILKGTYIKCGLDTFPMNLGWNCPNYPASLATAPCSTYKITLGVDPKPADLQTQLVIDVDTMSLCDTVTYEFRVKSTNLSNVYHINTRVVLANGYKIVPGSSEFKYPLGGTYTSIPDPSIAGNTSIYYVDSLKHTRS